MRGYSDSENYDYAGAALDIVRDSCATDRAQDWRVESVDALPFRADRGAWVRVSCEVWVEGGEARVVGREIDPSFEERMGGMQ